MITLNLNYNQAATLKEALNEIAIQMDDDGREGSFAASGLAAIEAQLSMLIRQEDSKRLRNRPSKEGTPPQ